MQFSQSDEVGLEVPQSDECRAESMGRTAKKASEFSYRYGRGQPPRSLFRLAQHGVEKVAQLLGGELVTFEIGDNLSLPIQNNCVQRVRNEAFVLPEIHTELMANFLDLEDGAR